MKNAGKACNNRLYRHIRTFEKIVKNYFVIYDKIQLKSSLFIVLGPCTSLFYTTNTESTFLLQNVAITKPAWTPAPPPQQTAGVIVR